MNELIYSTPEQEGISSMYLIDFLEAMKAAQAEIHGIVIAVNDKVILEAYQPPYSKNIPHTTHSLTKCFTNTALGLAYTNGLIRLDKAVLDYFPQYRANANEYLRALTIRDLITMRSGQVRTVLGNEWRPMKTSWVDAYFQIPWDKKPGSKFMYSSGNSYIISAIVQKVTGLSCDAYLKKNLTSKLGMRDFTWEKSPEGICSGGNGINICVDDMLKLGLLYLNGGKWNGEQLLDKHWVDLSLGYAEPTIHEDSEPEYNFHWRHNNDIWEGRGKFGQSCLLIPCLNMVVTAMMASKVHCAAELLQKYVVNPVKNGILPEETGEPAFEKLRLYTANMTLKLLPQTDVIHPLFTNNKILRYQVEPPTDEIKNLTLQFENSEFVFSMCDNRGIHVITHGLNSWKDGFTSMTGHYLHHQYEYNCTRICAVAYWQKNDELMMEWRYPEMPFWDHVQILFLPDGTITMKRWVNMNSEETERPVLYAKQIEI